MINEKLEQDLVGVRYEIFDLNQATYFYVKKMNRMSYITRNATKKYFIEELLALRYLENGIILHLTNLDDDNSIYSFRAAQKIINKSNVVKQQDLLTSLSSKLTSYRSNINSLKVNHRNKRIAHINSTEFPNLMEFLDFDSSIKPLVRQANEIGDFIWGKQINTILNLGHVDGVMDFRELFNELEIDITKIQGFH